MWKSIALIALGAACGAILRWQLGVKLNSYLPSMPPGTLAVNIIGGYIIGLAGAFFLAYPALPPEWRLFVITGFCGGLTTFSTFSAEVVALIQEGRIAWAMFSITAHLTGSLLSTLAGIGTWQLFKSL